MQIRTGSVAAAALGCLGSLLSPSASAKDLDALVRLLVPAYMAQNFAAVCVDQDSQFLSDLKNGPGSLNAFAEQVKNRVSIDLPEDVAEKVRVTAADTARQVARHELQLLDRQQASGSPGSLKAWCDRSAKPFILETLRRHEEKQPEFEKALEEAKR